MLKPKPNYNQEMLKISLDGDMFEGGDIKESEEQILNFHISCNMCEIALIDFPLQFMSLDTLNLLFTYDCSKNCLGKNRDQFEESMNILNDIDRFSEIKPSQDESSESQSYISPTPPEDESFVSPRGILFRSKFTSKLFNASLEFFL